jgi:hypothetical protein
MTPTKKAIAFWGSRTDLRLNLNGDVAAYITRHQMPNGEPAVYELECRAFVGSIKRWRHDVQQVFPGEAEAFQMMHVWLLMNAPDYNGMYEHRGG